MAVESSCASAEILQDPRTVAEVVRGSAAACITRFRMRALIASYMSEILHHPMRVEAASA